MSEYANNQVSELMKYFINELITNSRDVKDSHSRNFFSSNEDYTLEEVAANCKDMSSVATLTSVTSQKELDFIMGKALVYNLKGINFVLSF